MAASITPTGNLTLTAISTLNEAGGLVGAEISAFDSASARLFTTSSSGLQVVDLSDPANPTLLSIIDFTAAPINAVSKDVSSVAVHNGTVAVALLNADKTVSGEVVLLDAATGTLIRKVTVGNNPDMVVFTADGSKLLVANEGELTSAGVDSPGSVSIIDVATGSETRLGFDAFNGTEAALRTAGVRITPGVSASNDFEPEYIAISPDGTKAFVTLQENNAVAVLDLATNTFTSVVPMGTKDFSTLMLDFSDRDGPSNAVALNFVTGMPVKGLYMPDGIATYSVGGKTYYVTANEGDDRDDFISPDETARVSSLNLDDATFPTEATLKTNAVLGRLTVSNVAGAAGTGGGLNGDTDNDGDVDELYAYGGRSFSIIDADTGAIVYDSADILDRVQAATATVGNFLTPTGTAYDDTRSDNKGSEPESVIVKQVGNKMYAFVALERGDGGVAVFDITDPADVSFTGYTVVKGDISPEGITFVPADSSPTGSNLLIVSNEVSNSITTYEVTALNITSGDDDNVGTGRDDIFAGSEGNDSIDGLGGNDTVDYSGMDGPVNVDLDAGTANGGFRSGADAMLSGENGFDVTALITVGEQLEGTSGALNSNSTGDYKPVGIMDGIGAYELNESTVRIFVNHELANNVGQSYQLENNLALTGGRVSFFDVDKISKTIVDGGIAYGKIYDRAGAEVTSTAQLDGRAGLDRLCSAGLFEKNEFGAGRGIADDIFFTGEETSSGPGGTEWALDVATGELWAVPDMGRGGWENVTQVDTGTTTHVAFVLGDDTTGAPLYLYVGEKSTDANATFLERNGLSGGQMYVWKANASGVNSPAEIYSGTRGGTWVEIEVRDVSKAGTAGYDALGYKDDNVLQAEADALGGFSFSRPEDLSTNPNDGTQFVFASTGASVSAGATADNSADSTDTWGTVYTMKLDFTNLNAPAGALTVLYNSNTDVNHVLRNADNLDWADDGYIYVNEDRSTTWAGGANTNDASIVRIDPATGAITRVAEIDRPAVPAGQTDSNPADFGNWESSGVLDVSSLFGEDAGTLFLADVQAHSINLAAAGLAEGGQLVFLSKDVEFSNAGSDTLTSIENVIGTDSDDRILGNASGNRFDGLAGNDTLAGAGGNDRLDGGTGADGLNGGTGNDTFVVDQAGDTVADQAGIDTVESSVSFTLISGLETLKLTGGNINGTGNTGKNTIVGSAGANDIEGGRGKDLLTGAAGADDFVFRNKLDSGKTAATRDVVSDFQVRVDDIDLSLIDANSARAGNQAFTFIAKQAFSEKAGQVRFDTLGNKTIVQLDINGDAKADMHIELTGTLKLTAGDFIL